MRLFLSVLAWVAMIASAALNVIGAEFVPAKPEWLSDASVTLKESYDDNVFLSGVRRPPAYTVPRSGVAALQGETSWITAVSPRIAFNAAPAFKWDPLQVASLGYAPEFATYHNAASESYVAHPVTAGLRFAQGNLSLSLENTATFIDGDEQGPLYPGGLLSAYGTCAPRERREQWQDRAAITMRYTQGRGFLRPVASLLYYDLMTEQFNVAGYQNYPDRSDVNGGADLGWNVADTVAATLGYRYGSQYQEKFSFSRYTSSGDYHRILFGGEGTLWRWLEFKVQAGPQFHRYPEPTAREAAPVDDTTPITYYADASATATITTTDIVSARYKRFLWLSSIGKVPYYDSSYELSYRRRISGKASAGITGRFLCADYSAGNLPSCKRDDWQYTLAVSGTYAVTKHASVTMAYALDLGRNTQDGIAASQNREFDRNLVSVSTTVAF